MKTKSSLHCQKAKPIVKKNREPIKEARRYVDNAREILAERGKLDDECFQYEDEKYVRAAGNYLWLGVLMALDGVFHVRADRRTRVNIEAYQEAVSKRDLKLLSWLNEGYAQYFENEESLDWELEQSPGPEELDRLSTALPALFGMDYAEFYAGTDRERRMKYRLAWSVAVFIERGAREVRHDPFKTLKVDYVDALFETHDMLKATNAAFGSRERLQLFVSEWLRFWKER